MTTMAMSGSGEPVQVLLERGIDCATGRAGALDLIEAHKWFNIAALRGDAEAARRRQEIAGELQPSDIAAALRRAREWLAIH
jgi:TPR repeat protein